MRGARVAGLLCLAGSLALFVLAASRGELQGGLFLIVPYFVGSGFAALGAMLLLVAGLALLFLGALPSAPIEGERRTTSSSGGVVLLGPIPIVWGSDRRVLPWMIAAGALLLVLAIMAALTMGRP